MYCYKKTDKDYKNPIPYQDAVKFKTLYNKAEKILDLMTQLKQTLMFEGETYETKKNLFEAMDNMQSFQDNLKLKGNMKYKVEG
jgi:hypothetical protein